MLPAFPHSGMKLLQTLGKKIILITSEDKILVLFSSQHAFRFGILTFLLSLSYSSELELLLMPNNSWKLPLVQWPLFLLASKVM